MLNLSETLIRTLIKELISEQLRSAQEFEFRKDYLKLKTPTITYTQPGMIGIGKKIPPPISTTYTLQQKSNKIQTLNSQNNSIDQKFENWWISTKQNFKNFNNVSEIYNEYIKSNTPPNNSEQIQKLKALMLKKISHENRARKP